MYINDCQYQCIVDLIWGISTSSIPLSEYVSVFDWRMLSLISLNEFNSLSSWLDVTEDKRALSLAWADWVFCNTYPIDWGGTVYLSAITSSVFSVTSAVGAVVSA